MERCAGKCVVDSRGATAARLLKSIYGRRLAMYGTRIVQDAGWTAVQNTGAVAQDGRKFKAEA
eukprot:6013616-Amphidinium_carterae.1